MKRILSVDITRGLVMIVMALDHIRDLMHNASLTQNPLDFSTTTPAIFLTRWITHLCAPTFVFLSGVSAYLSFKQKGDIGYTRKFLITRGIWLIILEFTLITFAVWWDVHFRFFLFQVIAAIGVGFIILACLINLQPRVILAIGLIIVFGHDFASYYLQHHPGSALQPVSPLINFAVFSPSKNTTLLMGYPVIPWTGIMLAGFGLGPLFHKEVDYRKRNFLKLGVGSLLLFIALRSINIYGDPSPWMHQKSSIFTVLSFINVSKYPPSLLFCLLMLGIMFFILYFAENISGRVATILMTYGKVPLFYYLCHWYIIHPVLFLILLCQGFHFNDMFPNGNSFGRPLLPNGVPLIGVYLVWIGTVLILYPLCKWFGRYKASHPEKKWLSYL